MFLKYEIKNVNGEEVLYLYTSYQYEFANDFLSSTDDALKLYSNNFIQTNKIPFHGNKIYYVVDGYVVKKVDLPLNKRYFYGADSYYVNVQLEDNSLTEMSLKEYLTSILFSYYSQDLGDEVLKCICILFNTYAYKMMNEDGFIQANNSFGYYIYSKEYEKKYKNYSAIVKRIHSIIDSVDCIFLSYEKQYILPFIHYSNNGKTLSHIKYPYLSSVKSLWDLAAPNYLNIKDYDYSTLSQLFKVKLDSSSMIQVINNGYSLKMRYKTYSIREIKEILGLGSNDISIIINRNGIRFITRGRGNSLGLSLYGASCIEENGGNAIDILKYYFPKCILYKNIKELS